MLTRRQVGHRKKELKDLVKLKRLKMDYFIQKYKAVIINAFIFILLILVSTDFHKDFFLGAASGAALITLGESIGNLKKGKNGNEFSKENISVINK